MSQEGRNEGIEGLASKISGSADELKITDDSVELEDFLSEKFFALEKIYHQLASNRSNIEEQLGLSKDEKIIESEIALMRYLGIKIAIVLINMRLLQELILNRSVKRCDLLDRSFFTDYEELLKDIPTDRFTSLVSQAWNEILSEHSDEQIPPTLRGIGPETTPNGDGATHDAALRTIES